MGLLDSIIRRLAGLRISSAMRFPVVSVDVPVVDVHFWETRQLSKRALSELACLDGADSVTWVHGQHLLDLTHGRARPESMTYALATPPVRVPHGRVPEPSCVRGDSGLEAGLARLTGKLALGYKRARSGPRGPDQCTQHGTNPGQLNSRAESKSFK